MIYRIFRSDKMEYREGKSLIFAAGINDATYLGHIYGYEDTQSTHYDYVIYR